MSVSTIKLLENFAGYCAERNKVISENIANIGTENYQRKDVVFKDLLSENMNAQLKTNDERHFVTSGEYNGDVPDFKIVTDHSKDNVSGVNNVDIDKEMADLAENYLNFKFASTKISSYFKTIQNVIKGGGTA